MNDAFASPGRVIPSYRGAARRAAGQNLGTPATPPTNWSMRRISRNFCRDPRVIEENPLKSGWLILNLIILTFPARSARPRLRQKSGTRKLTSRHQDHHARAIGKNLAAALAGDTRLMVDWAMRYGNPSMRSRLDAMQAAGCDRILIVPAFIRNMPAATTARCATRPFGSA